MKYDFTIFLDCDGVINQIKPSMKMFSIDEECVKNLAEVTKRLNADIILSSTWRNGYDKTGQNHAPHITNLLKILEENGIHLMGITPDAGKEEKRYEEIDYYIRRNGITNFIILDDDDSLYSNKERVYLVNPNTGLTEKDVKKICKLAYK